MVAKHYFHRLIWVSSEIIWRAAVCIPDVGHLWRPLQRLSTQVLEGDQGFIGGLVGMRPLEVESSYVLNATRMSQVALNNKVNIC